MVFKIQTLDNIYIRVKMSNQVNCTVHHVELAVTCCDHVLSTLRCVCAECEAPDLIVTLQRQLNIYSSEYY